jgi:hypothetical protein
LGKLGKSRWTRRLSHSSGRIDFRSWRFRNFRRGPLGRATSGLRGCSYVLGRVGRKSGQRTFILDCCSSQYSGRICYTSELELRDQPVGSGCRADIIRRGKDAVLCGDSTVRKNDARPTQRRSHSSERLCAHFSVESRPASPIQLSVRVVVWCFVLGNCVELDCSLDYLHGSGCATKSHRNCMMHDAVEQLYLGREFSRASQRVIILSEYGCSFVKVYTIVASDYVVRRCGVERDCVDSTLFRRVRASRMEAASIWNIDWARDITA